MNSHEPPWSWQDPKKAAGNAAATALTIAASLGRALRFSPGANGDCGAVQAVPLTKFPDPVIGRVGETNCAQFDQGPMSLPIRARTRHVYGVSYSRSNGIRCAPKFSD